MPCRLSAVRSRMRFGTLLVLMACAASPAAAGTICGTVREVQSQQPVAHVAVFVFDDQNHYTGLHAETALNGTYCITNVPVGTYTVQVRGNGFADNAVGGVVVDNATGVDIDVTPRLYLADPAPNPASREVTFRIAARPGDEVTLEVFDVNGRLVKGWRGHGSSGRAIYWDLRDANSAAIVSGVYLVRLRAAGAQQVKRLVCVH